MGWVKGYLLIPGGLLSTVIDMDIRLLLWLIASSGVAIAVLIAIYCLIAVVLGAGSTVIS